jgi:hypothetical protein
MAEKGWIWQVFGTMAHRVTQKERTQRAFRAYLDLIDTADWLKREMRVPLESFDMTMQATLRQPSEFRWSGGVGGAGTIKNGKKRRPPKGKAAATKGSCNAAAAEANSGGAAASAEPEQSRIPKAPA